MSVLEDIKALSRRLDSLIESTGTATGSISLANGEEITFTITTSSNSNAKVLPVVDLTLYIGSVADANRLPEGSGITESQWQVIGPWSDWGATNNVNHKTKIFIRNISAGTQTVLIKTISRVIVNSPTPDTTT